MLSHRVGDNPRRTKIVDRAPCFNCQLLDRLCHWIANVTVWPHSGKPVLRLCIRVQHPVLARSTDTNTGIRQSEHWRFGHRPPPDELDYGVCGTRQVSKNILATTIWSRTRTQGSFAKPASSSSSSTDSHSTPEYPAVRYGIERARRAGVEKSDKLNCRASAPRY